MMIGISSLECGGTNLEDNRNGSLMRILPVAFFTMKYSIKDRVEITEQIPNGWLQCMARKWEIYKLVRGFAEKIML